MSAKCTTWWRRIIDGLVVLMFVWLAWPWVQYYLPFGTYEELRPDTVITLDTEISEILETLNPDLLSLYENRRVTKRPSLVRADEPEAMADIANYNKNSKSVVYITTEDELGFVYIASGSILTEDGVILTNDHVAHDKVKAVVTTSDGTHYPVTAVLAADEGMDVAFIKIDATKLQPIPIGNSDSIQIGDKVLVIGHPEGYLHTLSLGNISGIRTFESRQELQITNPISSGNSGGALLNDRGELIGIPAWTFEYEDNAIGVQNLNFAVPINAALKLLEGDQANWGIDQSM